MKGRRIFIDNFAGGTTRDSVSTLFAKFGKVESVTFPDHSMRDTPTHAFVVMSSDEEATTAIRALNNTDWNGARLTVTHSDSPSHGSGFSGIVTVGERENR